jgi:putative transposase
MGKEHEYEYEFNLHAEYDTRDQLRGILEEVMANNVSCQYCGGDDVVKYGVSRNGEQRYWCKKCKRAFLDNNSLPQMRTTIRQLGSILGEYYGGMSLGSIRRQFEQQHEESPSRSTLYRWLTRFSKIAIDEAEAYTPKVGSVWVADETALNVAGNHRVWLWVVMDADTRFILAYHLSKTRTTADALTLMKRAEVRAGKHPEIVLTDKLKSYLDAIEMAWGADTKHIPSKGFRVPLNTNLIERLNGTIKDRVKVMRGMKDMDTARLLIRGWIVHYNFFRPHESLKGKTPSEKAGIKFPAKDWLDVVKSQEKPKVKKTDDDYADYIRFIRASPKVKRVLGKPKAKRKQPKRKRRTRR